MSSSLPPVMDQVNRPALRDEAQSVAQQFSSFKNMVVVGIGGSSLGLRALLSALGPRGKRVIVCDELDPVAFERAVGGINWQETAVNIVSKSGGTLEIMAMASVLVARLKAAVGDAWTRHVVVTTDPENGFLRQWATEHHVASCAIPGDVGGRFSIFTAVGLLPLYWAGYDASAFLAGAQSILSSEEPRKWAEQHVAWDRAGHVITVVMPYSSCLADYARWFVQLWSESLGKNALGQTPLVAVGTNDQHAQVQMFAEGPRNKCIRFITVQHWPEDVTVPASLDAADAQLDQVPFSRLLETAARATADALAQVGCPSYHMTLPALSEHAMGCLMMGDIMMTVEAASLYGISPYGQPGVERGKKLWRQYLSA